MKKNSVWKFIVNLIVTIVFFISLISLLLTLFDSTKRSLYFETFTALLSLFSGYVLYIYNNSNNVFFGVNKFLVHFSRQTVRWEISYRVIGISTTDIRSVELELLDTLKKKGRVINDSRREESRVIKFENSHGILGEFDLRWNETIEENYSLSIIFKSQTSHKDVRKQWEFYRIVTDETLKVISEESNNKKKSYEEKSYYTISLRMDKNPFYLLTIKTYDKPQNIKFNLKFNVNGVKFESTNKKIVITTEDKDKVDTVLRDYVLLGKVS